MSDIVFAELKSCNLPGYDYIQHIGICLKHFYRVQSSWTNANMMCQQDGGLLVSINTMAKWTFLSNYLSCVNKFWAGLRGTTWINGDPFVNVLGVTDNLNNLPDSNNPFDPEFDCGLFTFITTPEIVDASCNEKLRMYFVYSECDFPLSSQSTQTFSQTTTSDWEEENMAERQREIFNAAMKMLSRNFPALNSQLQLPWSSLSKSSSSYYTKIITEAIQLIAQYVAPGQENNLLTDVCKKWISLKEDKPDTMTEAMIASYQQQNNRLSQMQILSLFANKHTKERLMELAPGLSVFKIDAARRHATLTFPGQLINPPKEIIRITEDQIYLFVAPPTAKIYKSDQNIIFIYSSYGYTQNATKENDEVLIITCLDNHGCTAYMRRNSSTDEIRKQLQQDMDIHAALEDHLQLKLTNAGINGSVFSCYGKPGEAIINAAKEKHASVIICGSRGHGKLRRTIMGSISSYIVHHSDIPGKSEVFIRLPVSHFSLSQTSTDCKNDHILVLLFAFDIRCDSHQFYDLLFGKSKKYMLLQS
ncbi:unnamed protein product [Mytilus edulis]|uniref:C-type lectin domain-containing protein n=1 Tax=Mytilus edulis TaxID=6550 RepID=A0A8S3T9B0_MYTED|nr:unnamed protein product [Mytilus edulis]